MEERNNMIDIAKNIKNLGWKQVDLAQRLGMTKQQLNQIINNENTPLGRLRDIADVIGCTIADLVYDSESIISSKLTCPHCGKSIHISIEVKSEP